MTEKVVDEKARDYFNEVWDRLNSDNKIKDLLERSLRSDNPFAGPIRDALSQAIMDGYVAQIPSDDVALAIKEVVLMGKLMGTRAAIERFLSSLSPQDALVSFEGDPEIKRYASDVWLDLQADKDFMAMIHSGGNKMFLRGIQITAAHITECWDNHLTPCQAAKEISNAALSAYRNSVEQLLMDIPEDRLPRA